MKSTVLSAEMSNNRQL